MLFRSSAGPVIEALRKRVMPWMNLRWMLCKVGANEFFTLPQVHLRLVDFDLHHGEATGGIHFEVAWGPSGAVGLFG